MSTVEEAQAYYNQVMQQQQASRDFWLSQYPTLHQYAGILPPVENMPAGSWVRSVTKTDSGYAIEIYTPPSAEQRQALSESRDFWEAQGLPQYAGVLPPVAVPEGAKIAGVTKAEGGGYSVSFASVAPVQEVVEAQVPTRELTPEEAFIASPEHQQLAGVTRMLNTLGAQVRDYNQQIAEAKTVVPDVSNVTYEQVLHEETVFAEALQAGKISATEYAQALIFTTKQLIALTPESPPTQTSLLPVDPAAHLIVDAGTVWLREDYKVIGAEPVTVPLSREQLTARLGALVSVAFLPETEAEAAAGNLPSYVPAETKTAFVGSVLAAYPSTGLASEVLQIAPVEPMQPKMQVLTAGLGLAGVSAISETGLQLLKGLITDPIGTGALILNPVSEILAMDNSTLAKVANMYVGGAGFYLNVGQEIQRSIGDIGSQPLMPALPKSVVPASLVNPNAPAPLFIPKNEAQKFGYEFAEVGSLLTASVALPVIGSAIQIGAAPVIVGELINLGVSQGVKAVSGEGLLTPLEAAQSAFTGGVFSLVAGGVYKGVGVVAPKIVNSVVGRVSIGAGIGGGAGYVLSGGDLAETAKGAALGAGLSLGVEAVRFLNVRLIQPRAEIGLSKSYAKTLDTGELWKPSLREQAVMKLTGAKPQAPFLKTQATELLSESYMQQAKLNEALLYNKPMPQGVVGRTGLASWTPTVKEAEIMRLVGVSPKVPSSAINTAKLFSGASMEEYFSRYKAPVPSDTLKRLMYAEDIFDFSIAPKTSLHIETAMPKPVSAAVPVVAKPVLPLIVNPKTLGEAKLTEDLKAALKTAEENEALKQIAIDKSYGALPESQLVYDYKGALGFKKVPVPVSSSSPAKATEVISTKNLDLVKASPKEALRYVDNFMQASKPLTQLKFAASWGEQEVITIQKPVLSNMAALKPPVAVAAPLVTLPKTVAPIVLPVQTKNPFLQFSGAAYYKQGKQVDDSYTEVVISYPASGLPSPVLPVSVMRVADSLGFKEVSPVKAQQNMRSLLVTQLQVSPASLTRQTQQLLQLPLKQLTPQKTQPKKLVPEQAQPIMTTPLIIPSPAQLQKNLQKSMQQPQLKHVLKQPLLQVPTVTPVEPKKPPPVVPVPRGGSLPRGLPSGFKGDLKDFGLPSRRRVGISKRQERVYPVLPAKKALEKALKIKGL